MKYSIFVICFIFSILCFASCKKEPAKGDYRGTFTGDLDLHSTYTTVYYFEVTRSTKKELWIKDKQSKVISKLKKHAGDSISGLIGFTGEIYNPDNAERAIFHAVKIAGTCNSGIIKGTFSVRLAKEEQKYSSTGTFILEPF